MEQKFVFDNPMAQSKCGCGTSFSSKAIVVYFLYVINIMNSCINYVFIIFILIIIVIFTIYSIIPKISIIILSYNRPENLDKSLPILNNYFLIDEIIVSHGSKKNYKKFNYSKVRNIKDFENNKIYGGTRRWLNVEHIKNDIVLFLDDDLLPSEYLIVKSYFTLLVNYYKNTIYGSYKRKCNKNGYFTTIKNNDYNTILTGLMICKKKIIVDYLNIYFNKDKKWLIKHKGNGEDLFLNIFIRKYYNEKPVYISGSYKTLNQGGGYSSMSKHYIERNELCKKYN